MSADTVNRRKFFGRLAAARAGNAAEASRWAEEYGRRFPSGRHAASVQRWISGAP